MVEWSTESFLIDTPGIRSFGLWDIDANTLGAYFPEFDEYIETATTGTAHTTANPTAPCAPPPTTAT